jgi:uncharacterized membrane protein
MLLTAFPKLAERTNYQTNTIKTLLTMNTQRKILKVLEILSALLLISNGLVKCLSLENIIPESLDFMDKLTSGGEEVAIAIGVIEILGAIGLLFAASRFYVSILLILIMVASIGSTIGGKLEFAKALWPTVVLFILALVAYYDNAIAAEEEEEEIEHRNDH